MTTYDGAAIDRKLAEIFKNGNPEVGLEAGTDQGLSPDDYIRVPRRMLKQWAVKTVVDGAYDRTAADTIETLRGKKGWVIASKVDTREWVIVSQGRYYLSAADGSSSLGDEFTDIFHEPHTADDLRAFIVANTGHISADRLKVEQFWWVHAVRFWSTVSGLVLGSKQTEYTIVPDPTEGLDAANEVAQRVSAYQAEALTASAARSASWRKSNHATGGDIANGFPLKWMSKNGHWPQAVDRDTSAQRQATTAFYVATHASCVHNTLAMMAPNDPGHWAKIDPRAGLVMNWEIRDSVKLRMSSMTQVAGTSAVVDSMVCLRALVGEGIAPFLMAAGQFERLKQKEAVVAEGGVKVASYANWFLDGHPDKVVRIAFNQQDPACSDLVGELAIAATVYYAGTTISRSPALANAATNLGSEAARTRWTMLARQKRMTSNEVLLSAYAAASGNTATSVLRDLTSSVDAERRAAMVTYNEILGRAADAAGVEDYQPLVLKAQPRAKRRQGTPIESDFTDVEPATEPE